MQSVRPTGVGVLRVQARQGVQAVQAVQCVEGVQSVLGPEVYVGPMRKVQWVT